MENIHLDLGDLTFMDNKNVCSGALYYNIKTNRFLFLYRKQSRKNNQWGIVGGTNEYQENPWQGVLRETHEEIGFVPEIIKTIPLETYISQDTKFEFHTYVCIVKEEFIPLLNHEHDGYAWVGLNNWPKPLHSGVSTTLYNDINKTKLNTIIELGNLFKNN
jgi:ADP-ribose pyrophosphatase YjhB (NUDIX family)